MAVQVSFENWRSEPIAFPRRNRWFLNHARGMRRGLRLLDMVEADLPATDSANIVLSCDADVVFRRRDTLWELARVFVEEGAALAGELRKHLYRYPEAQA